MSNVIKSTRIKKGEKCKLAQKKEETSAEELTEGQAERYSPSSVKKAKQDLKSEIEAKRKAILNQAQKEAKQIKEKAQKEAKEIKEEIKKEAKEKAKKEANKLKEKAEEKGYQEGLKQGREDGRQEVLKQFKDFYEQLKQESTRLDEYVKREFSQLSDELINLAVQISERILRQKLKFDKESLKDIVTAALRQANGESQVEIRVNPEDIKFLEEKKEELLAVNGAIQKINLIPDGEIELGGCIVETDFGGIDATVSSQLEAIEDELMEVTHNE